MSEKVNVDINVKAVGVDGGEDSFSAEMDIRYRNMGRLTFAQFESAFMGMFKGMADAQASLYEVSKEKKESGTIR